MGTITTVEWSEYVIGAPDANTGSHRVMLPGGSLNSSVSLLASGTDQPNGHRWTRYSSFVSRVDVNGRTFDTPEWYVTWKNVATGETFGRVCHSGLAWIDVSSESPEALFTGTATAYYTWTPEADLPPESQWYHLYIDAYDADRHEFIPESPWVEVSTTPSWNESQDPKKTAFTAAPYPADPLSAAINDGGFVNTDAAIAPGAGIKVSAKDVIDVSGRTIMTFSRWWLVKDWGDVVDSEWQIYTGDPRDAFLTHDSIVALIAIYNEQRFVDEVKGTPHPVGVEIYEIEALRRLQGETRQQLATLTQQLAGQEERTTTLTRRFDAATASLMAISARVEALSKLPRIAEPIAPPEERSVAGEQVTAGRAVARRGFLARFFARLFRRGA